MRFVDLKKLALPPIKLKEAKNAQQIIENASPDERAKIIKNNANIWQSFKNELANYTHDKCWYCESIQARSDNAVDHYRPKNQVRDCPNHAGYWWLAFDFSNYRYTCTFCNSRRHDDETDQTGGKWDYFPLVDESKRVYDPTGNIDDEDPCLLDPTRASDPKLLWFDETGEVVPRYTGEDDKRYLKAKISITLYHLNHHHIREKRQILFHNIADLVKQADRCYKRLSNLLDKTTEDDFNHIAGQLISMIRDTSEYSAASQAYLKGMRGVNRLWLDDILDA